MGKDFTFKMGSKVRDKVTGFTGIVTTRQDHVSGCNSYWVQPGLNEKGEFVEQRSFDEPRLDLIEEPKQEHRDIATRARQVAGPGPG